MFKKHRELLAEGVESYVFWRRGRKATGKGECKFGTIAGVYADGALTRLDGRAGFHSQFATAQLLRKLDEIDPDVVHLHNIHGYYINIEKLFRWLAAHRCQVKWTLHDCWAFTGHCVYFTCVRCTQWKTHCAYNEPCSQLSTYPKTISKRSCAKNFADKKRIFNLVPPERMELITPSQWLADLIGHSFLSKYPVTVRHNEIDRTVFKPTASDFRKRYGLEGKFVILGVALPWTERKGLDDFIRLAQELDGDRYAIVLVGLNKRQVKQIKGRLIVSPREEGTADPASECIASDSLVHPSVEEAFGMTAAETQACGTPVVVREGPACTGMPDKDAPSAADLVDFGSLRIAIAELEGGGTAILVGRTEEREQLAAIYTAADVFFNPTKEDNYPTVNLEARACGTPVVTYDVGGSRETVAFQCPSDLCRGAVVPSADLDAARSLIMELSAINSALGASRG